jgi:hypothetical protein
MSVARRSLQIVAFIGTLIIGVASMAMIVTQTTWFKEWLRGFIVRQAEDYVNGRLTIGRLDGNLFFGVELEDVDVTVNGRKVVEIHDVGLDYNALTFAQGHLVLDDVRLNKPTLRLERTAEGWNLGRLIKARTPEEPETSRRRIEVGEIGVRDGALYVDEQTVGTSGVDIPERIDKIDASVGVTSDEKALTVAVNHVSLRAERPQFGINALSGRITRTADAVRLENVSLRTEMSSMRVSGRIEHIDSEAPVVEVRASADKVDILELANVVPALRGMQLQPALELTARGPANRLEVDLNAREKNVGNVIGDLTVNALGPARRISGLVALNHFNVGPVAKSTTLKSDITGKGRLDLTLPTEQRPMSGAYSIDASRVMVAGYEARDVKAKGRIDGEVIRFDGNAAAYGGRATARGMVTTGRTLALDLEGHAVNVDLRNLPPQLDVPGVGSNLEFDYSVTGRGRVFSGDVRLAISTLAGATIDAGTTAHFTVGAGAPSYAVEGGVRNLDIQRIGREFGITALSADRFQSHITGRFTVKGSGGGAANPLSLDASGTITDSELFSARVPRFEFSTNIAGADTHVRAIGQFAGLNPAVVSGNDSTKGDITGALDVTATLRNYRDGVTADSIDANGRVNLGGSVVGGLTIDSAVVDGRYAERSGELTQLSIAGPDLNVRGGGTLALTDTGSSNLRLHVDSPSLEQVGKMVNQPLQGAAILDATITGNGKALDAAGTLQGSNIGHGNNKALDLDTQFTARVPDLTPANSTIDAKSHATFVQIGGRRINEVTAETKYAESKLDFKATAKEETREMAAAGSVLLHPDHQEIHLENLALRTQGIEWHTEPGSKAAVQYGKDRIGIQDVRLVNGEQRIEANGALGSPEETLQVRMAGVDVAQIDKLLLTNQQVAGRLDATATLSGPTDALRANGEFTLNQGSFQKFTFESLAGKVEYSVRGVNVDMRLQQNPQAWITAKGFVPAAAFRPSAHPGERGHKEPPPGEGIDVQVASSAIDLGVIQGFTSDVTKVTGSLHANVKITGAGDDPHAEGTIEIRGGTFAVPYMGTAYTGLDTRIDLKPDVVSISDMRIVDEHKNMLTVGGSLAVHARELGAVDIRVKSEGFEIIDNKMADLKLDTDVHLSGELRAPRATGKIAVKTGTINIGEVLERTGASPYSTQEISSAPTETAAAPATPAQATPQPGVPATNAPAPGQPAPAETKTASPTPFDALDLDVALTVPDDLIVKGNDLRPSNAPISFGDVNVTLGGSIQIRKAPGDTVRILGPVKTVRGTYQFQGRRFDILRDGTIRFQGAAPIDPLLDLRARREISGVEAFIRIRGTMRQPELSFSSNPPLDEADILSLIVFNQPINELGEGQQISLGERAGALAGGYLASGLAQSIGNALELEEFEIQAAGENGLGPSVTVGEQISPKMFARLRQGFGAEQATEFILEYQLREYLRFQGTVAETPGGTARTMFRRVERGGLDLIFFFSY